jgi:hypothetical protein
MNQTHHGRRWSSTNNLEIDMWLTLVRIAFTWANVLGFKAPLKFVDVDMLKASVGVIELSKGETILVTQLCDVA